MTNVIYQVNVVAFVADRSVEIGEADLPPGQPWVVPVPQSEMLAEYAGWGPDALRLLGCIREPNKWSIHVVYPPFRSYVKGQIALLGDAVSLVPVFVTLFEIHTSLGDRRMVCYHILGQVLDKAWKMPTSWVNSSVIHRRTHPTWR